MIIPANEILIEGTLAMNRQKQQGGGGNVSDVNLPNLNTCFLSLLGHKLSQTSNTSTSQNGSLNQSRPGQIDSNRIIWENIAAAVDQLLFRLVFKWGNFSMFYFRFKLLYLYG